MICHFLSFVHLREKVESPSSQASFYFQHLSWCLSGTFAQAVVGEPLEDYLSDKYKPDNTVC